LTWRSVGERGGGQQHGPAQPGADACFDADHPTGIRRDACLWIVEPLD